MTLDQILQNIQSNCDLYINTNSTSIDKILEDNFTIISSPFPEFLLSNIENNTWGVYVFYIKVNKGLVVYEDLNNIWQTNLSEKRLHSPKAIKGNFKPLKENQWHCFYVGKSENLPGRVSQHIHQRTAFTTYGLKLSEHDRLHENAEFAYSFCPLKSNPTDNKDGLKCLVVTLERHLRMKLKPLIGKQ